LDNLMMASGVQNTFCLYGLRLKPALKEKMRKFFIKV
jgi:hypothetical protein